MSGARSGPQAASVAVMSLLVSLGIPTQDSGETHSTSSPRARQGAADRRSNHWQTLHGEPRDSAAVDTLIVRVAAQHRLRAISIAVVQSGRTAFSSIHGEVRRGRRADTNTVFRAASLGKPVFAYLVLLLVDDGILDLDSPLVAFLPRPLATYAHYRDLASDPRHRALTVRHVLSQQSGLPNWHREGPVPLLAAPGERFGYSGEGYGLLQLVVEERTGRAVHDLARERVFSPLGMVHSSFLWERRFDEHFAVDLGTGLRPQIERSRRRASVAGSLITNAADYARFLRAVMEGRGLSSATHAAMLEPQTYISSRTIFSPPNTAPAAAEGMQLSWTLGWGHFVSGQREAIFHVGREEGCEGYAVAFPESRTAFVVMSVSPLRSTFTASLAAALIGDVYSPFDWMEYWRTVSGRPPTLAAIMVTVTALACVVVMARRAWIRRRTALPQSKRRPER